MNKESYERAAVDLAIFGPRDVISASGPAMDYEEDELLFVPVKPGLWNTQRPGSQQ